jgi:hypothetical protein
MKHTLRAVLWLATVPVVLTACVSVGPSAQQLGSYDLLRPELSVQRQPPTLELARPAFVTIIGLRPGMGAEVIYPARGEASRLIAAGRHPIEGIAEVDLPVPPRRSRGPCTDPGELTFWGPPNSILFPPQATNIRVFNRRGRTVTCYRLPGTAPGRTLREHHLLVVASEEPIVADDLYERVARFNRDPEIFTSPMTDLAERLSSIIVEARENGAWAGHMVTFER